MMLFEQTVTEQENYSQVERAALRLLKRDQEKVDQIMEQVFNKNKKNQFKQWDKVNPEDNEDSLEQIETSRDGKYIILKDILT